MPGAESPTSGESIGKGSSVSHSLLIRQLFVRREIEGEHEFGAVFRRWRRGFYGWMGMGGSVLQWNPSLRIGFAYAPTLILWHDDVCSKGARLQREVAECAQREKQASEKAKL